MLSSILIFWLYILYRVLRAGLFEAKILETVAPKVRSSPGIKPKIEQPNIESKKVIKPDALQRLVRRPRCSLRQSPNISASHVKDTSNSESEGTVLSASPNELVGKTDTSDLKDINIIKQSSKKVNVALGCVNVASRCERSSSLNSSYSKRKMMFEVGERVMLYGLNLTYLNGKIGTIVKVYDEEGRYLVQTANNKSARAQSHNMILQGGPKFRSYASFLKSLKVRRGSIILPSGTLVR